MIFGADITNQLLFHYALASLHCPNVGIITSMLTSLYQCWHHQCVDVGKEKEFPIPFSGHQDQYEGTSLLS